MKNSTLWRSLFSIASAMLIFNAGNLFATTVALVGGQGKAGYSGGDTYHQALFNTPSGMLEDSAGELVVADTGNNLIRIITAPETSQSGGSKTETYDPNGPNLFVKPIGVALDDSGNVYILNYGNGKNGNILEYDYLGDIQYTNVVNLTNAAAMAMDAVGNIYVTVNSNQILKITAPGVSNVVVTITNAGTSLKGLVVKQIGTYAGWLAVCDAGRNGVYLVNPGTGTVITNAGFHGAGDFRSGIDISSPQDAQFNQPMGVAETGDGSLIVTDYGNNRVKVVRASDGAVTNLYGVMSSYWVAPYPGFSSTLTPRTGAPEVVQTPDTQGGVSARGPNGVIFASDGTVFVTEDYYNIIREVTVSGLPLPPPPPPPAPTAPAGVGAAAGYGQINLTWLSSANATNYDIERSLTSGSGYTTVATATGTSYTDTNGIQDGVTYYYVLQAVGTGGESPISGQVSATPLFSPPPTIESVATNTISYTYGSVTLTWSVSPGATSYLIERTPSTNSPEATVFAPTTTYDDTSDVVNGETYYYSIEAVNGGGINPTNSPQVAVTLPSPPVPDPQIGYVTYLPNLDQFGYYPSVFNPGSPTGNTFNNSVDLVIIGANGSQTFFNYANTTVVTNVPDPTASSQSAPLGYVDNLSQFTVEQNYTINQFIQPTPNLMIKAVGEQSGHPNSDVVSALFQFVVGNPNVIGTNAAQFVVTNITVGSYMYYTTDGSNPNPTNPVAVGPITNGATLSLFFPNGETNLPFEIQGYRSNFTPSAIVTNNFAASNFVANTISFGFYNGEASSDFVGSPGQTFYAPVTLTTLPSTAIYAMGFNITVTNAGTNAGPPVSPGAFSFQSMLMKPFPAPPIFIQIPPYLFASTNTETNLVQYDGTNFADGLFTNTSENLLGVGWAERAGQTNLYNTKSQNLITYSLAHDDLFPNSAQPNEIILGGYAFQVPLTATNGQTYQIQIGRPSANSDGIGTPGSAVFIDAPTNGSLGGGALNSIKDVTMGQRTYIAGNSYPFRWFNAGDFGNTNLDINDVLQVFQSAIYELNYPPAGSDFFDAMDSCGATYVDLGHGYLERDTTITDPNEFNALLNGNDQTINQIAFGDGNLDVCDVYVTYRRYLDPQLVWFERFWTNGVRVAQIVPNTYNESAVTKHSSGKVLSAVSNPNPSFSITNLPTVNFTANDSLATAGQTLTIPVNATVFGQYPLRIAMLNITVVPLDGSPSLTTPISFTSGALGNPTFTDSSGNGNFAAVWLTNGITGISSSGTIGTLTVTIPANATPMSSYAVHFDHASGSPNGIASLAKHTLTGLITLSSRTSSYYNDGIPDSWRLRYFGTIYNYLSVSNADADGTGMENWQKYQAGLNPTDPTSVLNVGTDQGMAQSPQDSVIDWPTVNGVTYVIQRSVSLFPPTWVSVSTNIGNGTYMEIHDSATNSAKFYQVVTP